MLDRRNRPAGVELELAAAARGDPRKISVNPTYGCLFVTPAPNV